MTPKIEYTLECEPEIEPIRGHYASGEDEADRKLEDEIIERASQGDVWAWCSVRVKATAPNGAVGYSAWLGCCSYKDADDYSRCDYYRDQCDEAADALNSFGVSHRQSIRTEYKGPTNTRGSRIRVWAQAGVKHYPWDHSLSRDANHAQAAKKFAAEWEWTGQWIGGSDPDERGYTFVCTNDLLEDE